VRAAIAGTSICARTLTRCVDSRIVGDGKEAEAVEPLRCPRSALTMPFTRGLRRAGLKTIGDVASRGAPRNHRTIWC